MARNTQIKRPENIEELYVVRFQPADAFGDHRQDEYWIGETRQRGWCIYATITPHLTSELLPPKFYKSQKVAQRSADVLNKKCANRGMFDVVKVKECLGK